MAHHVFVFPNYNNIYKSICRSIFSNLKLVFWNILNLFKQFQIWYMYIIVGNYDDNINMQYISPVSLCHYPVLSWFYLFCWKVNENSPFTIIKNSIQKIASVIQIPRMEGIICSNQMIKPTIFKNNWVFIKVNYKRINYPLYQLTI